MPTRRCDREQLLQRKSHCCAGACRAKLFHHLPRTHAVPLRRCLPRPGSDALATQLQGMLQPMMEDLFLARPTNPAEVS
jgi:hypothetical protein